MGRPSIPPEKLLRALLLQAFYSIRSERQLMEQLNFNMLLARISQTHLGGVSSGADEPGCGSICVALRQSGPGLIV